MNTEIPVEPTIDLAEHYEALPAYPVVPGAAGSVVDLTASLGPGPMHDTRYELRAVVTHSGQNLRTGHYVAWVREDVSPPGADPPPPGAEGKPWVLYDDDKRPARFAKLPSSVSNNAYLIFYERKAGSARRRDEGPDENEHMTPAARPLQGQAAVGTEKNVEMEEA